VICMVSGILHMSSRRTNACLSKNVSCMHDKAVILITESVARYGLLSRCAVHHANALIFVKNLFDRGVDKG
jgi:hypothetical protein